MTTNKSQSSILILATIGVYFGLVVAGATPQVLAKAALTKQFNVRDEIEFKDDLDKDPDDERSPIDSSVQIYLDDVQYFLANLSQLRNRGKFDLDRDTFDVAQSDLLPCIDSNLAGRYTQVRFNNTSEPSRRALEYFSRSMAHSYSLGDCVASDEFKEVGAVDSRFTFKLDDKEFTVNIAVKKQSPQRALDLQRELESTLALFAAKTDHVVRKKVIENTRFQTETDQVFVILRLPRGSLETLLADAK